jgi:phage shock protein PspC (stress-responsive transcriptional regulator)
MTTTDMDPEASSPTQGNPETPGPTQANPEDRRRPGHDPLPLQRPWHGRMLAGVAAGIADYLNIDATLTRIALVVLTFVGGIGVPLYLAGWLLIPEEGADQSIASELIQSISARSS